MPHEAAQVWVVVLRCEVLAHVIPVVGMEVSLGLSRLEEHRSVRISYDAI